MRLAEMIDELKVEVVRLNDVIGMLERIGSREAPPPGKRLRKARRPMNEHERRQVADRMKRYWEKRRASQG